MNSSGSEFEETSTPGYFKAYRSDMAMEFLQQASSYYCCTLPVVADNDYRYNVDRRNIPLVTHLNLNMAAAYFNRSDLIVNTAQLSTQHLDHIQEIQVKFKYMSQWIHWILMKSVEFL